MRLCALPSLFLIAALCSAQPAAAGLVPGACSGRLVKWECVGTLTTIGATETVRMRFYDNETTVVEITRPSASLRMLVAPDGSTWFQGKSDAQPADKSFLHLPGAAIMPVSLLGMAFPDGPDSVPEEETAKELDLGRERIGVSAMRAIDGTIHYTFTERGKVLARGDYRAGELASPAGGFDLARWTRGEKPGLKLIERRD